MRRLLLAVAALTMTLSVETTATAAERCPKCGQVHGQTTVQHRQTSTNPLQQLMQLERRKNAWLARTFLGR